MVWAQEVAQDVVVDRVAGTVLTDVGVRPLIATSGGYGRGLIRNISRASVLANCAYGAPFIFGYLGEGTVACSWSAGQAANTCAQVPLMKPPQRLQPWRSIKMLPPATTQRSAEPFARTVALQTPRFCTLTGR